MSYDPLDHPLHGVGLEEVLSSVVRHYGWPVLAEQIPINCFMSYPTFASAMKFLKKTRWARERLEAFYLYKFKQCDLPSDEEHELAPRNRHVTLPEPVLEPAVIEEGDAEFFDDPASGPKLPSRKAVQASQAKSNAQFKSMEDTEVAKKAGKVLVKSQAKPHYQAKTKPHLSRDKKAKTSALEGSSDPWAKWRKAE